MGRARTFRAALFLPISSLIVACASTPGAPTPQSPQPATPPAEQAEPVVPKAIPGITALLPDGGVRHLQSGAQCPAMLTGLAFDNPSVFAEDGSDIACQYGTTDGGQVMTLYFTRVSSAMTLQEHASDAAGHIARRFEGSVLNEDSSRRCALTVHAITRAAAGQPQRGPGVALAETPCLLFNLHEGVTLVSVMQVGEWHVKARLTDSVPGADEMEISIAAAEALAYVTDQIRQTGASIGPLEST